MLEIKKLFLVSLAITAVLIGIIWWEAGKALNQEQSDGMVILP